MKSNFLRLTQTAQGDVKGVTLRMHLKRIWHPTALAFALGLLLAALLAINAVDPVSAQTESPAEAEWYARYWNNIDMSGVAIVERNVREIDYDWGFSSPDPAINADRFSARWTSRPFFEAGTYRFTVASDDGIRVWLDDEYIISDWSVHPLTAESAVVTLSEGSHDLAVEYFENTGVAAARLTWERVDVSGDEAVSISPARGPVGTVVNVTATGFPANIPVTVGFGRANSEPATSKTETTGPDGLLETTVTVPASAEIDEPWVVLVRANETEEALSSAFIVTAEPQPPGQCGDTYTVQPGDWLSRIARRCGTSVDAIVAANPSITDPSIIQPGQVLELPDPANVARVEIEPIRGPAGTVLDVTGTGFAANEQVEVSIGRANSEPASSFTTVANSAGTVETTVTVPEGATVGEPWVVLIDSTLEEALSNNFVVTSGEGATTVATTTVNLRLRGGPGTTYRILDVAPNGTTVTVIGRTADGSWIQVEYEDTVGWMAAWYTDVSGDLNDLPVTD